MVNQMNTRYLLYPNFIGQKNRIKATVQVLSEDKDYNEAAWLRFEHNLLHNKKAYSIALLTFIILKEFETTKFRGILISPKHVYNRDEQCLVAFTLSLLNINIAEGNPVDTKRLMKSTHFTVDDTVELFLNLAYKLKIPQEDVDFLLKFFVRFEYLDYLSENEIAISDDNER